MNKKLVMVLEAESPGQMQEILNELADAAGGARATQAPSLALYSDDELKAELARRQAGDEPAAGAAEAPKRGRGRPRKPKGETPEAAGRQISDSPEDRAAPEAEPVEAEDEIDALLQAGAEAQPAAPAKKLTHDDVRQAVRKCQSTHGAEVTRQRLVKHGVTQISAIADADLPKIVASLLEGVDG